MHPVRRHACVAAGRDWRLRAAELGSGGSGPEGGAFSNGFASAGRVLLGGEEGARAQAARSSSRAGRGEGLGARTPFSPPRSRPLGRSQHGAGGGAGSAPQALLVLRLRARVVGLLPCALWLSSTARGRGTEAAPSRGRNQPRAKDAALRDSDVVETVALRPRPFRSVRARPDLLAPARCRGSGRS